MTTDAAARRLFEGTFGAPPRGVWSAPGRVNLIGEHTDYNRGFVLPFAIERRTHVAAALRREPRIRVTSDAEQGVVEVGRAGLRADHLHGNPDIPEWARYPLGVVWATLSAADALDEEGPGLDLAFTSDVPIGAGLSSSAAIECATAVAANDLWGLGLDTAALARAGQRAENEAVGTPTGIMDQTASLRGAPDAAVFLDCDSMASEVVPLGFAAAGLEILVIDSGVKHSHSTGGYRDRRDACERAAATLGVTSLREVAAADLPRAQALLDDVTFRRTRHVVTENDRVRETVRMLREHGPRSIGALLTASHASMRDDFEISIPELDLAVAAALEAGALGARMTGGGFGGAAIALIERSGREEVAARVRAAFASAGFAAPTIFTVTPSAGASAAG